jgi:hypothetical protein
MADGTNTKAAAGLAAAFMGGGMPGMGAPSVSATSGVQSSGSMYALDGSAWTVNVPSGGLNLGMGGSGSGLSPWMLGGAALLAWYLLRKR